MTKKELVEKRLVWWVKQVLLGEIEITERKKEDIKVFWDRFLAGQLNVDEQEFAQELLNQHESWDTF